MNILATMSSMIVGNITELFVSFPLHLKCYLCYLLLMHIFVVNSLTIIKLAHNLTLVCYVLCWILLVWCVWESLWASGSPSNYTIGISPSLGCGGAHISECYSGPSLKAAYDADEFGPGRTHPTIHLLWQNTNLDHICVLGLCGSNISRHFLRPRDGNAIKDLPKLVQASRLHRLSIQHTPC